MKILIVGAGLIGTVYGAQLGAAGDDVSALAHGARTDEMAREGLRARDVLADTVIDSPVAVVDQADEDTFDLVLVALRRETLQSAAAQLAKLSASPLVLFFGNNPGGRAGLPVNVPGPVALGFPGVGGVIRAGIADYVRISQQPTTLGQNPDPRLDQFQRVLSARGFPVRRVPDLSGWLAYHAVFIACVSAALYRCQTDPRRLAHDRRELRLMCRAITEGFQVLRTQGIVGLPRNLALLHARAMQSVAVRYWAHYMCSPIAEFALAAHCRHAEPEMRALAHDVLARLPDDGQGALRQLLAAASQPHQSPPSTSSPG